MSKERTVYVLHEGVEPEQARSLRARAWRFVFDCWEQKKAAGVSDGEVHTVKEPEDDSRNRTQPQR